LIDISVCIVNWNCRDWLRALLHSLVRVDHGVNLEVIVVDNASTDGAPEMVAQEFPSVMLIRNDSNRGFSRANNQAARIAHGRYLFFLNNDTVVPQEALRRLFDYAEEHPDIGLLGPRLRGADGIVQVSYRPRPSLASLLHRMLLCRWTGLLRRTYRRYRRDDFDPDHVRDVDILMGAALFAKRDYFLACGGWDEDFTFGGEDMELSVRVGRGARVVYLPEVEILHHGRVSTRQHAGFAATQIAAGTVHYLRKTGTAWPGVLLYKIAATLDAPCVIVAKGAEAFWRWLQGKSTKARKSWLCVRAAWHFLTRGLVVFWRS
jgi:GT2 family glycosyltransferase